jgi:2-methylcitrate dehydratase PrpD
MSHAPIDHPDSVTRSLARFALSAHPDALPPPVVHAIRRSILDSVGVMVAGSTHPTSEITVDLVHSLVPDGPATIVGSTGRADLLNATLANAVMAHVLDWDDALLPMRLRAGCTLVPALIAVSEAGEATAGTPVATEGMAMIAAYAVGFEIQARLAAAISPEMPERGWHGTGVVGGVGVAAAVARLLGLDESRTAHAMGLAGTAAQGLVATFGTMAKSLNLGRAAAAGVQSALLAARGFTSHPDLLGTGGFLSMYDDRPRLDELTAGLGESWAVERNGFKPYPCGVVAHAAIDAVLELRDQAPRDDPPAALRLTVSPETVRLMGNPEPRTGLEARFSVRYVAAVAWRDGRVLPSSFEEARVASREAATTMAAIAVEPSEAVAQEEARAELTTQRGWRGTAHVRHARGTTGRPLSDDELAAKVQTAFEVGCNPNAALVIDSIARLEAIHVPTLAGLLARSEGD